MIRLDNDSKLIAENYKLKALPDCRTNVENCECGKDIVISASEKSEFNCMEVQNRTQAI
jgi:hypothetical protein